MLAPFFNQLAQGSAAQSRQLNQANIRWSEAQQRSPQFNEADLSGVGRRGGKEKIEYKTKRRPSGRRG